MFAQMQGVVEALSLFACSAALSHFSHSSGCGGKDKLNKIVLQVRDAMLCCVMPNVDIFWCGHFLWELP